MVKYSFLIQIRSDITLETNGQGFADQAQYWHLNMIRNKDCNSKGIWAEKPCAWWMMDANIGYSKEDDSKKVFNVVGYDGSMDKFGATPDTYGIGVRPAIYVNVGTGTKMR